MGNNTLSWTGGPSRTQHRFPSASHDSSAMPLAKQHSSNEAPLRPGLPQSNSGSNSHHRTSSFFSSFRNKDKAAADHHNQQQNQLTPPANNTQPGVPPKEMAQQPLSPGRQQSLPPQQQQQQQGPPPTIGTPPAGVTQSQQQLHPEIRSVVQLQNAHAHKIYFSGPLIRRIERQPDGQRPSKDEGWTDVWAQLGGTTLSIWDMKAVEEASRLGKEVPPAYVNTTDAFVQVLGSVTVPPTQSTPSKRYADVITLNTAGSNLLLFSCPSTDALMSWAAALRLSAWEKSRLEEIYTAHLIRITLQSPEAPSTLARGRMEGWARIRVAGQTDWKKVWIVVASSSTSSSDRPGSSNGHSHPSQTPSVTKKNRVSQLFSRNDSTHSSDDSTPKRSTIFMYASPKPKDRKVPLLTMSNVSQAFAVYPERPELISRSTLIKAEGTFGEEEAAAGMRGREGWVLVMPELEGGHNQSGEMLKWIIALHDAFELYGRPRAWTWDPRDPVSLMFAYPVGPNKDLLFLDRELAETLDPRDDRTSAVRSSLANILLEGMRGNKPPQNAKQIQQKLQASQQQQSQQQGQTSTSNSSSALPSLPPIGENGAGPSTSRTSSHILPPLSFDAPGPSSSSSNMDPRQQQGQQRGALTPITERSGGTVGRRSTDDLSSPQHNSVYGQSSRPEPSRQQSGGPPVLDRAVTSSPTDMSMAHQSRMSHDSGGRTNSPPARQFSSATSHGGSAGGGGSSSPGPMNGTTTGPTTATGLLSHQTSSKYSTQSASESQQQHLLYPHQHTPPIERIMSPGAASILPSPHSIAHGGLDGPEGHEEDRLSVSSKGAMSMMTSPFSDRMSVSSKASKGAQSMMMSPFSPVEDQQRGGFNALHQYQQQSPQRGAKRSTSPPGSPMAGSSHLSPSAAAAVRSTSPTGRAASSSSPPPAQSPSQAPAASVPATSTLDQGLADMDGVLYYMQQMERETGNAVRQRKALAGPPPPVGDSEEDTESGDEDEDEGPKPPLSPRMQQLQQQQQREQQQQQQQQQGGRRGANAGAAPTSFQAVDATRSGLGRKPSGARAAPLSSANVRGSYDGPGPAGRGSSELSSSTSSPPPPAFANKHQSQLSSSSSNSFSPSKAQSQPQAQPQQRGASERKMTVDTLQSHATDDDTGRVMKERMGSVGMVPDDSDQLDALAALSYLAVDDETAPAPSKKGKEIRSQSSDTTTTASPVSPAARVSPSIVEPTNTGNSAAGGPAFRSSFAPSKQAAERKAKAQAQQAAHHAATHKPGRANGKRKMRAVEKGAWGESSEEEEDDEEEEEEEDADSDDEPPAVQQKPAGKMQQAGLTQANVNEHAEAQQQFGHGRPPRTLPQIPGGSGRPSGDSDYFNQAPPQPQQQQAGRRTMLDAYSGGDARQTHYDGTPIRTQAEFSATPGAARQNMWSQVLEPGHGNQPDNSKFVQLEPESETMTKAFTPHGLLSAGIQDKQDRSAKKQEELARESGASLINVPNKPPPPQTGLLGAVTAHERDRKREGGLGAILTERERDKRVAEERQRKFDEQQRSQMDQMQSMYGGYNPMMMGGMPMMGMNPMMTGNGMNPMMSGNGMNPMMTGGMPPMMTGNGMNPMMNPMMTGYPGMMGYNPQHMFAAQQAAMQAYQQAMVAFSTAGSQMGDNNQQQQGQQPGSPGQMGMGNPMMGFDPRMSMMSMGMPQMMNPMGMQMTGMSGFDPRFPPAQQNMTGDGNSLVPPGPLGGGNSGGSSGNSSPARRMSPAQHSPLAQGHFPTSPNAQGGSSSRPQSPQH